MNGARPRHDLRLAGLLLTLAAVGAGGWWLDRPATGAPPQAAAVDGDALRRHFDQAVLLLHAGRHAEAVTALQQVLALAPRLPEAHANLGFARLGLRQPQAAREAFEAATTLAPAQANAYYGLAMAWEASGDLAMATGAMRSYLHLARTERPEHLTRARAALWTWDQARARPGKAAASGAGRELADAAAMTCPAPPPGPGPLPDSGNRFPMPATAPSILGSRP